MFCAELENKYVKYDLEILIKMFSRYYTVISLAGSNLQSHTGLLTVAGVLINVYFKELHKTVVIMRQTYSKTETQKFCR